MSSAASASSVRPFPWVGLTVLAAAIFASVTTEFLPTGLLPDMARELDVSESRIGLLVTVFAGTVVVSAAPLAALTRRYSRKRLVLIVMLVVCLGSILTAIAPTYELLVGARIIGGLAHGLFWAVVGAYAAHLVPKHQLGRAVAITGGGGTAAFILGVPLGTALGHALGWRLAFATVAVVILVFTVLVLKYLPAVNHRPPLATGEIPLPLHRDRSMPGVLVICAIILVTITGHNIFYTYIAPWLIDASPFEAGSIPMVLFLFGGAGAIGLVLAGILTDRFPRAGLIGAFAATAAVVTILAVFSQTAIVVVIAVVVWGITFGGAPAMLNARMLHTASARFRDTASALQVVFFNLGIGGGAYIGGLLLDGFGVELLPFVNIGMLVAAVALIIVTDAWLRKRAARPRSA